MASDIPIVRFIESSSVTPAPGSAPDQASLPLNFFDVFWIGSPPVERLFFYQYPQPTSKFLTFLLPSLKSSLSLALRTYYPLAGNLRRTAGTQNKFELYYSEGDSVSFSVAESEDRFNELSTDHARKVSRLQCLVPQLTKSNGLQPLFAVQLTLFPNQGIVIGTAVHHTACDGMSSMRFTHDWANICRSGALVVSQGPIIDRTLIPDPFDLYSIFYKDISGLINDSPDGTVLVNGAAGDLVLATFMLSQSHIQRLKQLALAKAKERNTPFHCSTIVVAFAYAWVGFVRTRGVENKSACLTIATDYRNRLQPPIPPEYFGNCVGACLAVLQSSDLTKEDGFVLAAEAIGKAVERLSSDDVMKGAENWLKDYISLTDGSILSVAGSPKFKVYELDFGFGKPAKVDIVSVARTGAIAVAESREEQGGVEIGLGLPKEEMDRFQEYFTTNLRLLVG